MGWDGRLDTARSFLRWVGVCLEVYRFEGEQVYRRDRQAGYKMND